MEDFHVDVVIGQGPAARTLKVELPRFTLVGATTRAGLLTAPLRARFGIVHRLDFYDVDSLTIIVRRSADILGIPIERDAARRDRAPLARHAAHRQPPAAPRARLRRGAARRAASTSPSRARRCSMLEVDEYGLDEIDRKLLTTIIERFGGGPVGLNALASSIGEDRGTIEDLYEPYLIQIGFLQRTPRGRVASRTAYEHLGYPPARLRTATGSVLGLRRDRRDQLRVVVRHRDERPERRRHHRQWAGRRLDRHRRRCPYPSGTA